MYDLKTGRRGTRGGKDLRRPAKIPPPCHTCPKGPEPYVKELTPRNLRAVDYWHLCRADTTGILPRDLIVLRNNSLCQRVSEAHQAAAAQRAILDLAALSRIA